mmetsp:Transcript_53854/g.114406  ORF Transcript_53854/g.114406 Transcript_53854/m.114406 type:complete len:237 (+) Transcript_53854:59-769(+)
MVRNEVIHRRAWLIIPFCHSILSISTVSPQHQPIILPPSSGTGKIAKAFRRNNRDVGRDESLLLHSPFERIQPHPEIGKDAHDVASRFQQAGYRSAQGRGALVVVHAIREDDRVRSGDALRDASPPVDARAIVPIDAPHPNAPVEAVLPRVRPQRAHDFVDAVGADQIRLETARIAYPSEGHGRQARRPGSQLQHPPSDEERLETDAGARRRAVVADDGGRTRSIRRPFANLPRQY